MSPTSTEPTDAACTCTGLPPGPDLPAAVQALLYMCAQPSFFADCRTRFGSTWTMRLPGFPPLVVTSERDAIRRVFTGNPLLRRHGNDLLKSSFGARSVMLLEPAEHLRRRSMEAPLFHGEAIRAHTARVRELAEAELSTWPLERVVATHPRARALTITIILELVLGVRDPPLQAALAPIFDSSGTPMTETEDALSMQINSVRALLGAHIANARSDAASGQRHDILALLVRARDSDGHGLSDEDLRDELMTLVSAGQTVATAMAWACDLLAHHPVVVMRLRATLARGERGYLKATVKEVLRIRTVADIAGARRMLEPLAIGDWLLGPDVYVLVDAQGVHGDPHSYPEPGEFRPERFLSPSPDSYSFIPFGGGVHRCLGASLASLQLELFIEALVNHVDPVPDGPPASPVRRGLTLAPSNEGRIRVAGGV